MSKRAMLIDYQYCSGCQSCEVSCRKEKGLSLDEWGIKVNEIGPVKFADGAWEWDYLPAPSRLCDLCEGRIEAGKKPLCELHCLAAVIKVIPVEEVSARLAEMNKDKVVVYLP
jgi:Fe-S-cluster-containing dehydrogenase component